MKLTKLIILLLAISADVAGLVSCRTQPNGKAIPHLLYGKASLSKEEKQILNRPFEDYRNHDYRRKAYKIAMICLKHRLSFSEVKEMVQEPGGVRVHPDTGESALHYRFSLNWDGWLIFEFDSNGNHTGVCFKNRPYPLPPIGFITCDTPVEAPPLPYREGHCCPIKNPVNTVDF